MSEPDSRLVDTSLPALPPPVGLFSWPPILADDPVDRVRTGRRLRRPLAATVVAEIALTAGALLGVGVMGITVAAAHNGIRPLVVRSGSMEPTIPTGSMILVKGIKAPEIEVGDVVAVDRPDHTRVTHRVLALDPHGEAVELTLKGDANEDPDPVPVTVRQADRLVWQAPMVGQTVAWLATAQGGFVMGCIASLVALHVLSRRSRSRHRGVRYRPAFAARGA